MNENDPAGHYNVVTCKRSKLLSDHEELLVSVDLFPSIGNLMFTKNESKVIFVDAAHTCYKEIMIINAVMQDGNGCLQSIASCLCCGESDSTYIHFFEELKRWVTKDEKDVIVVSDRHKSIESSVKKVYGNDCMLLSCLVHILRNVESWVTSDYRGKQNKGKKKAPDSTKQSANDKGLQEFKKRATYLVNNYARATNLDDEMWYRKQLMKEFPLIFDRLKGITTIWTRLHAGENAFGLVTSNAVEVINSRMDRAVNMYSSIRDAHIVDMTIQIYSLMQAQICSRKEKVKNSIPNSSYNGDRITPYVMKIIDKHVSSLYHNNMRIGNWIVQGDSVIMHAYNREMIYRVNLNNHECTCGAWKYLGYPCKHAVAYILFHGYSIHPSMVTLVKKHFLVSTVLDTCAMDLPNFPNLRLIVDYHRLQNGNAEEPEEPEEPVRTEHTVESQQAVEGQEASRPDVDNEYDEAAEELQQTRVLQVVADMANMSMNDYTPVNHKRKKRNTPSDDILQSRSHKKKRGLGEADQQKKFIRKNGTRCNQGMHLRSYGERSLTEKMKYYKRSNNWMY